MADHLTEEEQIEQLKRWWKDNGASLVAAILLGLIAYFGFQWWQNHERQQAEQAAILYNELLENIDRQTGKVSSDENKATLHYLAKQLQDDFASSQYAANASLFVAKVSVSHGQLDDAQAALTWVVEHGDENFKPIASLRLARIYLAQEKYDEALSLLDTQDEAFLSLSAEIKGDIFAAKQQWDEARTAYQQSIDNLGDSASFRNRLLPIKLANIPSEGQ